MSFLDRLREAQAEARSLLCVGLDPDPARMPPHLQTRPSLGEAVVQFNAAVVTATRPHACAYKLNLAFYEALGADGHAVLSHTLDQIPPGKIVVLDGKRGDIGNSARMYARALFERLGADACTVAPYMGTDAVEPFLADPDRGVFVLTLTSNPGSRDLQHRSLEGAPLYRRVAERVADWNAENPATAGCVVGATRSDRMEEIRAVTPGLPFLIPGVGAQGGDVEASLRAGAGSDGSHPVLITSSRSITYASTQRDFAEVAGRAAERLNEHLLAARPGQ